MMNNEENKPNEEIENDPSNVNSDYYERVTNDNHPDPSAKRNIGLNGETERQDQKDKLENLHIGGNETTGYGANNTESTEAFAQGPGFEFEGSDTAMGADGAGIRRGEQPLGAEKVEKTPPATTDEPRI